METERTGLGVSVKGRTSPGPSGPEDVGIYVKSVLAGGAASRDGRLQTHDQLININGSSLLGLTNAQAMETLKNALEKGKRPGSVSLTVVRRKDSAGANTASEGDSTGSHRSGGSAGEVLLSGWQESLPVPAAPPNGEVTITHRRTPPEPAPPPGRNPVLDRLTGRNTRNDSYYLATHDSWSGGSGSDAAPAPAPLAPQPPHPGSGALLACPTVNMPSGDTVVIESDPPPTSLTSQQSDSGTDVAYASQTSLDTAGGGFTRDQLGRQSISEKRHATKDAKSTDTYQRTKRAREEREAARRRIEAELDLERTRQPGLPGGVTAETGRSASQQLLNEPEPAALPPSDVGPSLGMKKSSSLESLQTMVHQALSEEGEQVYPRRGPVKVVRGRGCNESFRAAVDRSYEAPLGDEAAPMETVDEEAAAGEAGVDLFSRDRAARQSSLSSGAVEGKKGKGRRSGLLKGLGSMFRFGRHRKASEPAAPPPPRLTPEELRRQQEELNRVAARRRAEDEQRRAQQSQRPQQPAQPPQGQHRTAAPPPPPERSASRPERVQQLREQHQRRHAGRQGQYRADAADDRPELPTREAEAGKPSVPAPPPAQLSDRLNNNVPETAAPFWRGAPLSRGGRSSEYFRNHRPAPLSAAERAAFWRSEEAGWRTPDHYEVVRRAGSRSAQGGGDAQAWYGPYGGYDEAQHGPRRQHQMYHSQRGGRPEPPRPLGSFYEYESVQAVMRLGGGEKYSNRSLPRHHERRPAAPPLPPHGMKHAVSAGLCGVRRPQPLGIPPAPLGMPYTRRGSEGILRGPHRPPPPPLSPPGSRV